MNANVHREDGWTLIELLVAMTLMIVVLSATLFSFNAFSNNTKRNTDFNDQQDQIRVALNQIVRQARNLANPTTGATVGAAATSIAYASLDRVVFQTTDPSKQWVSYCLNTSTAPSTTGRESIWYQTTSNNALTPTAVAGGAMVSGCPAGGAWQTQTMVADFVTNQKDAPSVNRPLFQYFSRAGELTAPVASGNTSQIVRVAISVFMRINPNRPPAETELASAAYMRNQNQPPTDSFSVETSGTNYTFDAGASADPEGRTLAYDWYTAPTTTTNPLPAAAALPSCRAKTPDFSAAPTWACLGTTVVLANKSIPAAKYVFLRVTDPGNLQTLSPLSSAGNCVSVTSTARLATDCGAVP